MQYKERYKKFLNIFLKTLKVKSISGGLEISDSWLRYAYLENDKWNLIGVRLPQNVVVNGQIKNYDLFIKTLNELRNKIFNGKDSKKVLNVIVSLSSIDVYSQIFTLPIIEGENLEKAIKLNIKMLSPQEENQTYSSWQIVSRDQKLMRLEILSAFINKEIINDFKKALTETKFMPRSIESYSFSLTRFFVKKVKNFQISKNYLILNIDDSGIKSLIIRNGNLYFNYFSFWSEIFKDENQISWDKFEIFLIRHLHQVVNFYNSRWADEIDGLFLISPVFVSEIKNIIIQNFDLKILDLDLDFPQNISSEWFIAIGSYYRNEISPKEDQELNLLGGDASQMFIQNQILQFIQFWRLAVISSAIFILLSIVIGNLFLNNILNSLKIEHSNINSAVHAKEARDFQIKIEEFNKVVDMVSMVNNNYLNRYFVLQKIIEKISNNDINIKNLSFNNDLSVKISAVSKNEENISKFKKNLESDNFFRNVNLPFSEIKPYEDGKTFFISFSINPSTIQ
ncbi:MAG: PilN domain-containing protein [Patescibacteria group bacterium]|nr:PilN domain-containing protein [Patescibacteria group bacterium]MCX7589933.1 PilN domain-containing protein [Patescibacteria group bacterium]MDW8279789.1 hypothetical protein [bacterium]